MHVSVSVCAMSLAALGSRRPGPPGSFTFELRCGPAPSNVARCAGGERTCEQADFRDDLCVDSTIQPVNDLDTLQQLDTISILYMVMRS